MRVLVINLDRAPERLTHTTREFAAAGVRFERLAATDGKTLPADEFARWRQGTPHFGEMRAGEVACYLSHRRCWEIAAAGSEPLVICEDDLYLGENARGILADASWIPADADIIKLEKHVLPIVVDRKPAGLAFGRQLVRVRGLDNGAGAYILAPRCAARLLQMIVAVSDPFDQILFNPRLPIFSRLVIYQMVPALCIQDSIRHHGTFGTTLNTTLPRDRVRRKGFAEIKRRFERPFEQAVRGLKDFVIHTATQRTWVDIDFQ